VGVRSWAFGACYGVVWSGGRRSEAIFRPSRDSAYWHRTYPALKRWAIIINGLPFAREKPFLVAMRLIISTVIATFSFIVWTSSVSAQESAVFKIALLYPADSGVGRVFQVWARAVDARTNGAVQLDFDWTSGDEGSLIARMKDGSLDGALLSSSGLSRVSQSVQRFEIPGSRGGIVISSKTLAKLSAEQRAVLVETANVAAKNLTKALPK